MNTFDSGLLLRIRVAVGVLGILLFVIMLLGLLASSNFVFSQRRTLDGHDSRRTHIYSPWISNGTVGLQVQNKSPSRDRRQP